MLQILALRITWRLRFRVLLAGDAEARGEGHTASGPYTGPLTVIRIRKHKTL